jgi:hypothetical protein
MSVNVLFYCKGRRQIAFENGMWLGMWLKDEWMA